MTDQYSGLQDIWSRDPLEALVEQRKAIAEVLGDAAIKYDMICKEIGARMRQEMPDLETMEGL